MCRKNLEKLDGYENLTPHETKLVDAVLDGLSNKAIAEKNIISEKKLEKQLTDVYHKLGFTEGKEKRISLFAKVLNL